jgi:hypothetical protein
MTFDAGQLFGAAVLQVMEIYHAGSGNARNRWQERVLS